MGKQSDSIVAKRFLKMEMLRRGISTEKLQSLHNKNNLNIL